MDKEAIKYSLLFLTLIKPKVSATFFGGILKKTVIEIHSSVPFKAGKKGT